MSNPWAQFGRRPAVHGQPKVTAGSRRAAGAQDFSNPPALANLQHWFDLTDAPTVFSDVAGTILATNGSNVRNITNKGFDGQAIIDAGTVPKYATGVVNGLNVLNDTVFTVLGSTMVNGTGAGGFAFATVSRRTDTLAAAAATIGWDFVTQLNVAAVTATGWRVRLPGDILINTGKPVVTNEWVWNYGTIDAAGLRAIRTAGAVELTGSGTYLPLPISQVLQFLGAVGQLAEVLIWDKNLIPIELGGFIGYADLKYGAMPF